MPDDDMWTTCDVQLDGRATEVKVPIGLLRNVLNTGDGEVTTVTARRYQLTWDPETGYTATRP